MSDRSSCTELYVIESFLSFLIHFFNISFHSRSILLSSRSEGISSAQPYLDWRRTNIEQRCHTRRLPRTEGNSRGDPESSFLSTRALLQESHQIHSGAMDAWNKGGCEPLFGATVWPRNAIVHCAADGRTEHVSAAVEGKNNCNLRCLLCVI